MKAGNQNRKTPKESSENNFFRPAITRANAPLSKIKRMPQSFFGVQRNCAGSEEEKVQPKRLMRKTENGGGVATNELSTQLNHSKGSGSPLSGTTNQLMSNAFGNDFSNVRIHTGSNAVQMNQGLSARAFAHGSDVYFNKGEYNPESSQGKKLLAHELTHVVQQTSPNIASKLKEPSSGLVTEKTTQPYISKFGDSGHHLLEDYALPRAGLDAAGIAAINRACSPAQFESIKARYDLNDEQIAAIRNAEYTGELRLLEDQISGIHRGNTQRDYSQVPVAGNVAFLGQANNFGGYQAVEHFDNFIFDIQNNRWRTRGEDGAQFKYQDLTQSDPTPIHYIESQLNLTADHWNDRNLSNADKLVWVGNAFHTVEDFFAHSNFVELIQNDFQHGRDLLTGSVGVRNAEGDGGGDQATSLGHILAGVSAPETRSFYEEQAHQAAETTVEGSHSRIAKDTPDASNYPIAIRLAALVIKELTTDLLIAMLPESASERRSLLQSTLLQKVRRYLRPPNANDPWWETIQQNAPVDVDAQLNRLQRRTAVTINHAPFSPLRNIEASSMGPIRLPLGLAQPVPVGDALIFFQLGIGIHSQPDVDGTGAAGLFGGAQVGGRF